MRKIHFIAIVCLLLSYATMALAQKNTLSIPDITAEQGKSVNMPVNMENTADIVAVQFTITTVDGVTLQPETAQMAERGNGHHVTVKAIGTNKYMVMAFSAQNNPFTGRLGSIMNVQLSASRSLQEGSSHPITLGDVVIADKSGANLATGFKSGVLTIAKSPDLEVSNVTTTANSITYGESLVVNWQVRNIGGLSTSNGWKEFVYLTSEDGSTQTLLGTIEHGIKLEAGNSISRGIELVVPRRLGISDKAKLSVKIKPYSDTGEPSWLLDNNEASSENALNVSNRLFVGPDNIRIDEANGKSVRMQLTRSGSLDNDDTFSVQATADSRLQLPAEITIPRGQADTYFYASVTPNGVLDNDSIVDVNISGGDYEKASFGITLLDDTNPRLTLTAKQQDVTEGGRLDITIEAERAAAADKAIALNCDLPARFKIPAGIVLPKGQTAVDVTVEALDDEIPDVEKVVTFAASADGYQTATLLSTLIDNDMPNLEMQLTPTAVSEADGPLAVSGVLRRTTNIDKKVTIRLSDDSNGGIYYARQTIEMAAGEKETVVNLGPVDNNIVDGERTYNITAAVYIASCSCNAGVGTAGGNVTVPLTVYDNDGPTLTLTSSTSLLKEGGEMSLTLSRNTDNKGSLQVNISSNQDDAIEYPQVVTIADGEASATFTVKSKSNDIMGDDLTAMLTAESEGYAKSSVWFTISDQTLPDARITAISSDNNKVEAGESVSVTLTISNVGNHPLPEQTKIGIYVDNARKATATAYLQEDLKEGESVALTQSVTLPSNVGNHNIYAVVNDGMEVKELLYTNNTSSVLDIQVVAPFSMSASTDKEVYKRGETVVISGKATGKDVAHKTIEVYVINQGYRHTISAQTEADGSFSVSYEPYNGQIGHFSVGACYPTEKLTTEMAGFDIYGMQFVSSKATTCDVTLGDKYEDKVSFKNPGIKSLTGITARVLSKPEQCDITLNVPQTLNGGEQAELAFALTPKSVSEGTDWETIDVSIESAEGAELATTLYYYCRNKKGKIEASVARINTTMIKDGTRDYPFTITNVGKGETGKITLSLPQWMSSVTPVEMSSLAQNESADIILRMKPTEKMQLNVPVTGNIGINCSNGDGLSIPFNIEPVSTAQGTLTIDVCDENTYYTQEAPHVSGANVVVTHPTTGKQIAAGVTNSDGIYSVSLPEGYYAVSVTADKHDSYNNNILVDPGKDNKKVVNLSYTAIKVDWNVKETEVEDEYEIKTTVKYETQVPTPVVVLDAPSSIPAKDLKDGESLIYYATFTNKGMITAKDVQLILPTDLKTLKFEAIENAEPFDLAPQQSVFIPVRVSKVASSTASKTKEIQRPIDDDPCASQMGTLYFWDCGLDRKWHRYNVALQLGSCKSNDPSTWDNSGNGTYGGADIDYVEAGGGQFVTGSPSFGVGGNNKATDTSKPLTTTEDKGCEPCQNTFMLKLIQCGFDVVKTLLPKASCFLNLLSCEEDIETDAKNWRTWAGCVTSVIGCLGIKKLDDINDIVTCLLSLTEPCELGGDPKTTGKRNVKESSEPSYITEFRNKVMYPLNELNAFKSALTEYFGNSKLSEETDCEELQDLLFILQTSDEDVLTPEKYIQYKPKNISVAEYNKFIERLNNSSSNANDENSINFTKIEECVEEMHNANEQCVLMGYRTTADMLDNEIKNVKQRLEESSSSVCSSITLQFTQQMVMTRQAFRGTLTVFNGHESEAMKDVKLNLTVKDEDGNLAMSDKFQVNPEKLEGFAGELDFASGWNLDAQQTGVATVLFIPTKNAAPTVETRYAFGGTLSYVDPYTGLEVTRQLSPITLTVKPSPNLNLTYFMQRDILGDDPLTEEVEPSEEAEFSLLINNVGYGDATNVKMTTNQPEIVENEKGLNVKFDLMSSQLNGEDKTLALGGSVATDFGNIPAKSTAYAQWWIKSSLLGHFTDYDVEATHLSSYGNKDLSLLNEVTIHELIRSIDVERGDKMLKGFMTNDIADANDMPDMLYLSDGETEEVNEAKTSSIGKTSATTYRLTITPAGEGWNYGNIKDPTYGISAIKSVVRESDGKQISLRNFWQTDRTLRDGKDPVYENRIHFVDEFNGRNAQSYVLTFEPTPELLLEVASIEGTPAEGEVAYQPVENVRVMFNKYIAPETFTADDIKLAIQGKEQESGLIKISTEDNKTFSLDLTSLNESVAQANAANGYYMLTIQTSAITDYEGYQGKTGKTADWIMYKDGQVKIYAATYPQGAGDIEYATINGEERQSRSLVKRNVEPVQNGDDASSMNEGTAQYGSTVVLTAKPKEGYVFESWSLDGEVVSTDVTVEQAALGDLDYVANFTKKTCQVNVDEECVGGIIANTHTGFYQYGDDLELVAEPDDDYVFSHWVINGKETEASNVSDGKSLLTITVNQNYDISAVFKKERYEQNITLMKGWNWISSYLAEPVSTDDIADNSSQIIGSTEATDMLQPVQTYKVKATSSFISRSKGRLFDIENTPVAIAEGWNWIGSPLREQQELSAAIKNPEDGDYVVGQMGFAQYQSGSWEGTLDQLKPNAGYLYKSVNSKNLLFADNSIAVNANSESGADDNNIVDMRKYSSTMNFIGKLMDADTDITGEDYRVYVMAGDECRGVSQLINGKYYLTVYGEKDEPLTLVYENMKTQETFVPTEELRFSEDVMGSRTAPYVWRLDVVTGIDSIFADGKSVRVYNINGCLIDANATLKTLKHLAKGIYLVNGIKYVVK